MIIAILVIAAGALYYFFVFAPPAPPAPAQQTGDSAPLSGVQTYRSSALDLSFSYNATDTGVLEQSHTIYVYAKGTPAMQGQWIEEFSKLPSETFAQSIERQILAGFSTSTCKVEVSQSNKYQGGYMTAEISYPAPVDPNASPLGHEAQCNGKYDKTNGIRYFLYDSAHSDRFYFLSIGQYPIIATGTQTWQDTLVIGK